MRVIIIVAAAIVALVFIGWLGLQITPRPFAPLSRSGAAGAEHASIAATRVPLPDDLPDPVARFYTELYGNTVPRIESAIISGRARLRIQGIPFPARFRFTHAAGDAYRHYIETTWFGIPVLKVNEHYTDGHARLDLPFGVVEGAKVDQGANLALWAEAIWYPSVWITDERVRWEPMDESTAFLVVPFTDEEQRLLVRFDPESGHPSLLEAMRYKGEESTGTTLWLNRVERWGSVGGQTTAARATVTWLDDGTPWADFRVEEVVYNSDVTEYVRATGP
jgi:hypothetical protein